MNKDDFLLKDKDIVSAKNKQICYANWNSPSKFDTN